VAGEGCIQYLGGQEPEKKNSGWCWFWCVTDAEMQVGDDALCVGMH